MLIRIVIDTEKVCCGNFMIAAVFLWHKKNEKGRCKMKKRGLSLILILVMLLQTVSAKAGVNSSEDVMHSIAEKIYGADILEDPNMIWFLADIADYSELYPESEFAISEEVKQACIDKIIAAADAANAPSSLAKDIIALRALGYDARQVYNSSGDEIDVVSKLAALVDTKDSRVTNIYTLPYIIIALNSGEGYMSKEQETFLLQTTLDNKASWQSTSWGTDGATPMLLALSKYIDNPDVKAAIDETIPMITALQEDTGLIANAASSGLAIAALSALGIDVETVVTNKNSLIDGLMSEVSEDGTGFNLTTNSFATEQGFRGLVAWKMYKNTGGRIYDFSDNAMEAAYASWQAKFSPVSFTVTPDGATVIVDGQEPNSNGIYDLSEGEYSYRISKDGYYEKTGTFTVSAEEASGHIEKNISVALDVIENSGTNNVSVNVKVMIHDADECNNSYTYRQNEKNYYAVVDENITIVRGCTVYDALVKVLRDNDIAFSEGGEGYISSIDGLGEFDHGSLSGWQFTLNGQHKNTGAMQTYLKSASTVVWFYTDDYTRERGSESYAPSNGTSKKVTYTVTFTDAEEQVVNKNGLATEPEAPKKDGYIFDGWYIDEELTQPHDFTQKVTKDINLYAKWTKIKHVYNGEYTDVEKNDWYYDAVVFAFENELMQGNGTEFLPENYHMHILGFGSDKEKQNMQD